MKLLATCTGVTPGSWTLFHDRSRDARKWRALVLIRPAEAQGTHYRGSSAYYYFGWNGDRLSVTPDFHALRRDFPAVMDWLNEVLPIVTWWERTNQSFRAAPGEAPAVNSGER